MNEKNFNWSLIPSFLAALEHGSLMGAARATGVSQPTLGRHIAELEQQLNVLLFERTGRGLQATPNAMALAEAAQTMQSGAASFSRLASGSTASLQGVVRISASQPVACFLLPPLLANMRQALPDVTVAAGGHLLAVGQRGQHAPLRHHEAMLADHAVELPLDQLRRLTEQRRQVVVDEGLILGRGVGCGALHGRDRPARW